MTDGVRGGQKNEHEFLSYQRCALLLLGELLDVAVRERALAQGGGVNLGANQADRTPLEELHVPHQFERLDE